MRKTNGDAPGQELMLRKEYISDGDEEEFPWLR